MLFFALILAFEALLLGGVLLRREPKLLLPAVVFFLPVEVFEVLAFEDGGSSIAGGFLNPGQDLMMVTVLVGVFRFRHEPARLIPNSSMIVPLGALLIVMLAGVGWSDSLVPVNGILILPLYVAFIFVAPAFIEDRGDVERIIGAFLIAAGLLALLAAAQRGAGIFAWRDVLVFSDGVSYRANATFGDPNILARFIAMSLALAGGLILATGARRQTLYLAVPLLGIGSLALIATASRSGWLMLLLTAFIVILAAPVRRYTKARIIVISAVTMTALLAMLSAQGGAEAERVGTLTSLRTLLGAREFLIQAGWEMFKDSPWVGMGAGAYQNALTVSYLHVIPAWAKVTLSHTSVITVLAELGTLGAIFFSFVIIRMAFIITRVYFANGDTYHRVIVGWLGAALLGVFLHSQAEGRLLDEPYLWVLVALFIAFETRPGLLGGGGGIPGAVSASPATRPG
jgi:O-antigen ligase